MNQLMKVFGFVLAGFSCFAMLNLIYMHLFKFMPFYFLPFIFWLILLIVGVVLVKKGLKNSTKKD